MVVGPCVSANAEAEHRNRVTVVGPVTYYARRVLREVVVGCSRTDHYASEGRAKEQSIPDWCEAPCDRFQLATLEAMQNPSTKEPVQFRSVLLNIVKIFSLFIIIALSASPRSFAAEQASDVPTWLRAHVGESEGQIAQVILQRARALLPKSA